MLQLARRAELARDRPGGLSYSYLSASMGLPHLPLIGVGAEDCAVKSGFGADAVIDLVEHPVLYDAADFGVVEEHAGLATVAVHTVDYQFFEVLVEGVGKIVAGVGGSCLLQVRVGEGVVTDLLPEEFVGGGEVGAEAVIEELNHLREGHGSVFIAAGADFGWGRETAAETEGVEDGADVGGEAADVA